MQEFTKKNKSYLIAGIVFLILIILFEIILSTRNYKQKPNYFTSTWNNQEKLKETISFTNKKETNLIKINNNIDLWYENQKIQYSGNILNYKIIDVNEMKWLENLLKNVWSNTKNKLKNNEKYARIANWSFDGKQKSIYFPAKKIIFSWCNVDFSWNYINIKKLTNRICKIAIFPKLNKKYQFYNKWWEIKFEKDDIIILKFTAKPITYNLGQYINSYLTNTYSIVNKYINYIHTYSLINIPSKFKIRWKIQKIKIYKITTKTKLDSKTASQFWIKNNFWIPLNIVFWKNLPKRISKNTFWTQVKNFKVDYLSWNTEINFIPKEGWKYLIYFKWKYDYNYFTTFKVKSKFSQDDFKYEINEYSFSAHFKSIFPFNKEQTEKNIKNFFKPYEVNISWWSNREFKIYYHIPPKKLFSGNLVIANAIKPIKVPLKIYIKKIPSKYTYAWIEWNLMNVIPKNGYWGHHLSIGYKNLTKFDLYFQKCTLNPNVNVNKIERYSLDINLLKCKWKIIHKIVKNEKWEYWKENWIDYTLPKELNNTSYFKVSFYKNFSQWTKYFKKTNIWITTKKAGKKYYIFANNFNNGNFTTWATILFYKLSKNTFKLAYAQALINGEAIFTWGDIALVQIKKWDDETYSIVSNWWRYRSDNSDIKINDNINSSDIWQNNNWWNTNTIKIYGYTDRWLYKAGDNIFFAGWVRNLKNKTSIPKWKVVVKLKYYGNEISKTEIKDLDSFGGFKWKFTLPKSAELWVYQIQFIFSNNITYSQDIKIEEFQKPVFFSKNKLINQNWKIFLKLNPQYYFGGNLKDYDLSVNWELKGKDICWDCRWWNDKEYYYNWSFKNSIYSGWKNDFNNLKNETVLKIINLNKLKNISYKITLKANITIKDNKTDEKHFYTEYFTVNPPILIWLKWQPVDRIYNSDIKNNKYKIEWKIENKKNIKWIKTHYSIYKKNFSYSEEKWVDGSYYYVNDEKFYTIKTWNLESNKNFSFEIPISGEAEYFARVWTEKDGKILWEVQKRFYYYDWSYDDRYYNDWYMWDHKNNITLDVNVPKKEYKLNEKIPVNINPYIKWAKVLITVERWNNILDTYKITLTWWKIQIPVKENYYPNINISVAEFVGENVKDFGSKNKHTSQNSTGSKKGRPSEPRFYIGYTQAWLSKNMVKLNIFIKTNKKEYKPWEKIKFTIYTLDANWNPVDARLSIAIVDKALADLYDLIKKPIPYFYNKLGSFIVNLSSWKNLYQALKVFNSNWEKWWGWGDGGSWISGIRKKLYDLAFWRWWVFTKNGKITLQATAPDNLTTWMIDVVWITKDIKLWTKRAYFKTTKPLIVQPNLPTFITVWDSIKLPISVLTKKDLWNISLTVSKWLENNWKITWTKIDKKQVKWNEKTYFNLKLWADKFNYSKLYLKFVAKASNEQDALQVKIPIRKKWFILHNFAFTGSKNTKINVKFEDIVSKATYSLWISKMPVEAFTKALKHLLHYPYGCTEQLSSGLYPILVTKNLTKKWIELWNIIKGGKINLWNYREGTRYVDIKSTVEETIAKIFRNQKSNGGLGYWPDEWEKPYPILSTYVYGLLKNAQKQWFKVNKIKLKKLESYLDKIWNNPIAYLYYQWIKSSLWEKINVALFENIYKKNVGQKNYICKTWTKCKQPQNLAIQVLAYAIYVNLWKTSKAQNIKINWDEKIDTQDRYWTFLNNNILKSIYLRAKLKIEWKITPEIQKIVMNLLEERDSNWTWGRGTQKNVQILIALGEYMKKLNKKDKTYICKVKINNLVKKLKFKRKTNLNLEFENIKSLTWNISCNDTLLIEQKTDYILKDLWKIKTTLHNLTGVNWTYTGWNNIWDTVTWNWTFKTLKKADKLAVEFYIPSNYKFLTTISKQNNDRYNRPFEIHSWEYRYSGETNNDEEDEWECGWDLSHYEVRFDRLFLYFNELPANTNCKIRIKTIKAFNWKTNIMPVHIFEMYKTNVWWRKVVK